jgi:hypothetical protein
MKSTIIYAVVFVLAFTLIVSCNQEQSSKEISTDLTNISWTPCKNLEDYGEHEIDKDSAETSLKLYKDYIDRVKSCLSPQDSKDSTDCEFLDKNEILNYGSEVDFDLLLQVLSERKLDCSHKLFLMNGIRPVRDDDKKIIEGKFVTEIIFVHEEVITGAKTNKDVIIHTYFDFTRPCPNGCPKGISGIEYPEN